MNKRIITIIIELHVKSDRIVRTAAETVVFGMVLPGVDNFLHRHINPFFISLHRHPMHLFPCKDTDCPLYHEIYQHSFHGPMVSRMQPSEARSQPLAAARLSRPPENSSTKESYGTHEAGSLSLISLSILSSFLSNRDSFSSTSSLLSAAMASTKMLFTRLIPITPPKKRSTEK